MEVWEDIVNNNSNAKKQNEYHTRKGLYMRKVLISAVVALAFILTTLVKLVHPVLGETGMSVACMIAFYNLGREKECA